MLQLLPKPPKNQIEISDLVRIAKKDFSTLSQKKTQVMVTTQQALINAILKHTEHFLSPEVEGQMVSFSISNTANATREVTLFRGINSFIPGVLVSDNEFSGLGEPGIGGDGALAAMIGNSGTPDLTISELQSFLAAKNVELRRIRITNSNASQFTQHLVLKQFNPLTSPKDKVFRFADSSIITTPDQKTYELPDSVILTNDSSLHYKLMPGTDANPNVVNFDIELGLIENPSMVFRKNYQLYAAATRQAGQDPRAKNLAGLDDSVLVLQNSPVTFPMLYGGKAM